MKRLFLFAIAFSISVLLWINFAVISCKMVGLSSALGPVQSAMEAPFFSNISSKSNVGLRCQYVPQNQQGINPNYLLKYLQQGFYDLASIIFRQSETSDIAIAGMDIPGISIDPASSRIIAKDFAPFLNKIFEEKYQAKIIAIFSFGKLELFCAKPVKNLADLQDLKIRISSGGESSIFRLLTALGAKPLSIEYGASLKAIQGQFIDCAISTYASAENSGWLKYLPYRKDLSLGNTVSAYVINLKTWKALNSRQQIALKNSIENLSINMVDYSARSSEQSILPCSRDDSSCSNKPQLTVLNQGDMARINQISIDNILKPWLKNCNEVYSGCKSEWLNSTKNIPSLEKLRLSDL